jgi:hypothetical protein
MGSSSSDRHQEAGEKNEDNQNKKHAGNYKNEQHALN